MTEPTAPPANAGRLQGGPFVPGVSGNPAGKKPGTRHRATRLAEKLMAAAQTIGGRSSRTGRPRQGGDAIEYYLSPLAQDAKMLRNLASRADK